ncbi:hypothetical protein [Slackia exigua]|uniref:hypothetical protein n=1 Tax=Slackia exigua TaxID=84109 RepID=UPI0020051A4E|nr:hypothetical protein [Slackia exigua]MCK6138961.1 hypothetical protein [Slackia exigua]
MDQNSTNKPAGSGILRVTSIILIVYAVIALVAGLFMMMGVYVLAADADVDAAAGVAAIVGIVAFLGGLLNLFVGVVGFKASKRNGRNSLAFVLGIISVVFGVCGIITSFGSGEAGSIANAAVGTILPALYLYGVIETRKGIV